MKVLTICGPYRDQRGDFFVGQNIQRAREAAEEVWALGICAICLHKNTEFMSGLVDEELFLRGAREIVGRSDGILLVSGWEDSSGSIAEIAVAARKGLVIFCQDDPEVWAKLRRWSQL